MKLLAVWTMPLRSQNDTRSLVSNIVLTLSRNWSRSAFAIVGVNEAHTAAVIDLE
jgi:hypothetical protein